MRSVFVCPRCLSLLKSSNAAILADSVVAVNEYCIFRPFTCSTCSERFGLIGLRTKSSSFGLAHVTASILAITWRIGLNAPSPTTAPIAGVRLGASDHLGTI